MQIKKWPQNLSQDGRMELWVTSSLPCHPPPPAWLTPLASSSSSTSSNPSASLSHMGWPVHPHPLCSGSPRQKRLRAATLCQVGRCRMRWETLSSSATCVTQSSRRARGWRTMSVRTTRTCPNTGAASVPKASCRGVTMWGTWTCTTTPKPLCARSATRPSPICPASSSTWRCTPTPRSLSAPCVPRSLHMRKASSRTSTRTIVLMLSPAHIAPKGLPIEVAFSITWKQAAEGPVSENMLLAVAGCLRGLYKNTNCKLQLKWSAGNDLLNLDLSTGPSCKVYLKNCIHGYCHTSVK